MKLTVYTPTGATEMQVESIKGRSAEGAFVILPHHEPYIAVADTEYGNGIIEVTPTEVKLLAD